MSASAAAKPVILFETNEVPVRLVEDHVRRRPDSTLARLLARSRSYETVCEDEAELDPWISWPTLHRGVIDRQHHIMHLGQSLDWADRNFPPVWRLLHDAGVSVGVFGSLHSSNVPANAEAYAFYVPDYFAAEPFAHPREMLPFQELNLVMTRKSGRNVDTGVPVKEAMRFGASALANGLSVATMTRAAAQLAGERVSPVRKLRRRNLQPQIGLDLFVSLMERRRPAFATFYTNHVAASMHRFWAAHFVDDYAAGNPMDAEWIARYQAEVPEAMNVLDGMLARLVRHAEARGAVLVMASSLGQAAVEFEGRTRGFTTVTDVGKLMDFLDVDRADWTEGRAMVPCVSVELKPELGEEVARRLAGLEFMGHRAERNELEVPPLSFDLKHSKSLHLYFYFEGKEPEGVVKLGNKVASPAEAGFGFFQHEDNVACSAHHIAEGAMLVFDPAAAGASPAGRERVSTLDIAPALLRHFGVTPPAYMRPGPNFAI